MQPIRFGASATAKVTMSLPGNGLPPELEDLGPLRATFDEFRRNVKDIPEVTQNDESVDTQQATVVIDKDGARTEITTAHNGTRTVPVPKGFQNTESGWKTYFDRLFQNMWGWEMSLFTKEERHAESVNASKKLVAQIAANPEGAQILGDEAEIQAKLTEEQRSSNPKPVTLNVQIGAQSFAITRHYLGDSIWHYEITPKERPGRTLTAEIRTFPEIDDSARIQKLEYKDEDNFRLDLKALYTELLEKSQRPVNQTQERSRAQAELLLKNHLEPMSKALMKLDKQIRYEHNWYY